MAEWKKSIVPSITVIGALAAFVVGTNSRATVDKGSRSNESPQTFLAGIEGSAASRPKIPEGDMFYQLLLLLDREYVEKEIDEDKLAIGAIKGAINGLWDPLSQFFAKEEFDELKNRLNGKYAGIGVETRLVYPSTELAKIRKGSRPDDPLLMIPAVEIAAVLPGGQAEKAGIKVGDRLTGVGNKWLVSFKDVAKIRQFQAQVANGKMTADQYKPHRADFQKRARDGISIARALDLIETSVGKHLNLYWKRGEQELKGTVVTEVLAVPSVSAQPDGTIKVRMFSGVSSKLREMNLTSESVLDLRQGGLGDSTEVKPVLEVLAPAGKFGEIVTDRAGQPRSLVTKKGSSEGLRFRVLVDRTTRGAAEVIAKALEARGYATLVGGPTSGEPVWLETVALDSGQGYRLNTGRFQASGKQ